MYVLLLFNHKTTLILENHQKCRYLLTNHVLDTVGIATTKDSKTYGCYNDQFLRVKLEYNNEHGKKFIDWFDTINFLISSLLWILSYIYITINI